MESLHSPVIIKGNLNKQFKFPHNGNTRPKFYYRLALPSIQGIYNPSPTQTFPENKK